MTGVIRADDQVGQVPAGFAFRCQPESTCLSPGDAFQIIGRFCTIPQHREILDDDRLITGNIYRQDFGLGRLWS